MIKHNEIEIANDNPFANCQLDRKKYADILTNIVSTYSTGFVMSINNKWGTGKTTFIRMWEQDLKKYGFQTVLFNAWENDFENNPLTALMGELKTLTKKNVENPHFENALKNAANFTKNLAPVLVKAVVKKYIGESCEDLAEGTTKSLADIFERDVNEYADKKKSIFDFKESLKKFIADTNEGKPLVFIVDELDRCRPDYAVSILEQIKHFFSIPNIVFVLSIDKEQLGHAICGVYGSEQIDTDEYLRRFIDLEYSIPQPSNELYCKYLYEYFEFDDFFKSDERRKHNVFQNDSDLFIKTAYLLLKKSNATLRQIEKIFGQTRLILKSFQPNQYVFSNLLFILIFLKIKNQKLYNNIENNKLTLQELSDAYADLMPSNNKSLYDINLVFVEALLIHFYNNNQEYENRIKLFEIDSNGLALTQIKSKTEELINKERFKLANSLQNIENQQWDFHDLDLQYLLKKINLTEPIYIN